MTLKEMKEREIGKRYGRLTVVEWVGVAKDGQYTYRVKCDCGNEAIMLIGNMRHGKSRSCGCYRIKHGDSKDPVTGKKKKLYRVWQGVIDRCNYKSSDVYSAYGGRGITVCSEWYDYTTFRQWAELHGYAEGLEIDRINNDGNYEPSNCRFSTRLENASHTQKTIHITVNGETRHAAEWARRIHRPKNRVYLWIKTHGLYYAAQRIGQDLAAIAKEA